MADAERGAPDGIWAVVPAAGVSARLAGPLPKQYVELAGRAILQRSLDALLAVPSIVRIVVALRDGDERWAGLPASRDARLATVSGAESRAGSVAAGVAQVRRSAGDAAWVLVHDAARPLVDPDDIERLIAAVTKTGAIGGLLGVPVQDTLKRVDAASASERTVDRNRLWQAQTPQLFRAGELGDALAAALADPGTAITDEASAFERLGRRPLLVGSRRPNFKITWPRDIVLAEALLAAGIVSEPVVADAAAGVERPSPAAIDGAAIDGAGRDGPGRDSIGRDGPGRDGDATAAGATSARGPTAPGERPPGAPLALAEARAGERGGPRIGEPVADRVGDRVRPHIVRRRDTERR